MPGMEISSTMTSGFRVRAASSAAGPSLTLPTIAQVGDSTAVARSSIAALSSTSRTRVGSDNVMLDRILDERCRRLDLELFHHPVLVKRNRPGGDVQDA